MKDTKSWSHKHDFPIEEIYVTYKTIAGLIVPRLRAFKSLKKHGYPSDISDTLWEQAIQKMIDAFELLSDANNYSYSSDEEKTINEGLDLLRKYYRDLWD